MKKILRRTVFVLGFFLLPAFFFLIFLPVLVSTEPVRKAVLSRAGEATGARIEIADWSLSWKRPLEAVNLLYEDHETGVYFTLEKLSVSSGLLEILRSRNFGDIVLEQPLLKVRLPQIADDPDTPVRHLPSRPPSPDLPAPEAPAPEPVAWPDFSGRMVWRGGTAVFEDERHRIAVADIESVIDVTRNPAALEIVATGRQKEETGVFACEVDLMPGIDGLIALDRMRGRISLLVEQWDLAPVGRLAGAVVELGGEGQLDLDLQAGLDSAQGTEIKGELSLQNLLLHGDILRGDRPFVDIVRCSWNIAVAADGVAVHAFNLHAPFAEVAAQGSMLPDRLPEIGVRGRIDLALLAGLLPNTLALHEALRLETGRADFDIRSFVSGDRPAITVNASTDNVAGMLEERPVSLSAPMELSLELRGPLSDWEVQQGRLRSSFALLEASGDSRNARMSGSLDAGALLAEAGQFINPGGWDVAGVISFDADYRQKTAREHHASMRISAAGLRVASYGHEFLDGETIEIAGEGDMHLADDGVLVADKVVASISGLESRALLSLSGLSLQPGGVVSGGDVSLEIDADLARLGGAFIHIDGMRAGGRAKAHAAMLLHEEFLLLNEFRVDIGDFVLAKDDFHYAVSELMLRGRGRACLEERNLSIEEFVAEGLPGRVQGEIMAYDRGLLPAGLSLQLEALIPIGKSLEALKGTAGIEQLAGADGDLLLRLETALYADGSSLKLESDAALESLRLPLPDGSIFEEERIALNLGLLREINGELSFDPLLLESSFLGLSATGALYQLEGFTRIRCRGALNHDLANLAQLASAWTGEMPFRVVGVGQMPFTLDMPLDGNWLDSGAAEVSLYVEEIEGYGLRADSFDVSLSLRDGVADLAMETAVNDGKLDLRLRLEEVEGRAALLLPEHSTVLSDVSLTDEMADKLLALVHPLFKGAMVTKGSMDLVFERFFAPLEAHAAEDVFFDGVLRLKDVELAAAGMLDKVRDLARIGAGDYRIGTRDLLFSCAGGRIETSPLRLNVGGHPVEISGSSGLDKTLDYTVSTPVTERLVGRDAYAVLKDTVIAVPVRGTISSPRLGEDEVREAVAELVRQAGRKLIERGAESLLRGLIR